MRAVPARPSRELKSDFSDVLGSRAGSARSTRQAIIRMGGFYAVMPEIASDKRGNALGTYNDEQSETWAGSIQPADLLLGHHALDILGLALDAVARAPVGFDRQAGDDGIDAARLGDGAALRPLQLVMDVVIDREIVGHRPSLSVKPGL